MAYNSSPFSTERGLAKLYRYKSAADHSPQLIGPEMVRFYKQSVQKRQGKLAKFAECWAGLVPDSLSEHCSLHSFSRGTLTILVDSSSHLYDVKQLLLAGMQDQLLLACRSVGLRKIVLRPGAAQWEQSPRIRTDRQG